MYFLLYKIWWWVVVTVSFIVCQALRPLLSPAAEAMLSNIPPEPSNWWGAPANRKLALTSWQMDPENLFPPVFPGQEQAPGRSPLLCLTLIRKRYVNWKIWNQRHPEWLVNLVLSLNLWAMVRTVQLANASWNIWNFQNFSSLNSFDLFMVGIHVASLPRKSVLILITCGLYLNRALDGVIRFNVHRRCCFVKEEDFVPVESGLECNKTHRFVKQTMIRMYV